MNPVINFLKRPEVRHIIILFIVTRIVLSIIGVSSRMMLSSFNIDPPRYSANPVLAIWGVWDTGYYLGIADHGYVVQASKDVMSVDQANYAFFPLYPVLIKLFSFIVGNLFWAGLIVSNFCLLLSAWVLYKLVRLDSAEEIALSSIKYLFLYPAAFILSGVFSESLFLLLLLSVFYYARKNNWLVCGLLGFLLVLCRPVGILILAPIAWEYLASRRFKVDFQALYLLCWPLGLFLFFAYIQSLTGNYLDYFTTQTLGWGHVLSDPLAVIWQGIASRDIFRFINVWIFIALTAVLVSQWRRLRISYLLAALVLILFPLFSGPVALNSLLRFLLPIFPFFIAFAYLTAKKGRDELAVISLALLQGFLMVFWTLGFHLIV